MEAAVNPSRSRRRRLSPESGFSMVEMLFTAFILAIGILGLTMLQVMSMRTSTGGRSLATAVTVGEGVLESIQSEGRHRMLFLKNGGSAPATTFFSNGNTVVKQFYAFDGTQLAASEGAFFTVEITPADVVALSSAGGAKHFTVVVTFPETPDPSNPTAVIKRTVTLTRQVVYA